METLQEREGRLDKESSKLNAGTSMRAFAEDLEIEIGVDLLQSKFEMVT